MAKEVKLFDDYKIVIGGQRFIEIHNKDGFMTLAFVASRLIDINKILDNVIETDPDKLQFCFEIEKNERYVYCQIDKDDLFVTDLDISYSDLSEELIEDSIDGYYPSLESLKDHCGDDSYKMIVMECYFENSLS